MITKKEHFKRIQERFMQNEIDKTPNKIYYKILSIYKINYDFRKSKQIFINCLIRNNNKIEESVLVFSPQKLMRLTKMFSFLLKSYRHDSELKGFQKTLLSYFQNDIHDKGGQNGIATRNKKV